MPYHQGSKERKSKEDVKMGFRMPFAHISFDPNTYSIGGGSCGDFLESLGKAKGVDAFSIRVPRRAQGTNNHNSRISTQRGLKDSG